MRRLLIPPLLTALMTAAPASALSTLTLPVTVPLAGVQGAANARVPAEFARVDESREFAGGLLSVRLTGTVTRAGHVSVKPAPEGDALIVSVPIRASFRAEPAGLGSFLARDFGGAATVSLRVQPFVTSDWQAGAKVTGDYTWTDPLGVELTPGVRLSVQALVDPQVRAQLDRVAADVARAVREGADLRARAGALKLTVGASFDLNAGLGRAPAQAPTPLPALKVAAPPTSGVDLSVPVRLPYPELSQAATREAGARPLVLPVPLSPTLRVERVTVTPRGSRLNAAVTVTVSGPLGLKVRATADVAGTPALDPSGRVVTLSGVTVTTRREGLTGRVIGWLADARAQAYLRQAARFDLTPRLAQVQRQVQARLPFVPTPGVTLSGTVGALRLTGFQVAPDALVVTAAAGGQLAATVDAGKVR